MYVESSYYTAYYYSLEAFLQTHSLFLICHFPLGIICLGDHDNALLMHKSELHICQSLHDATGEAIACRNVRLLTLSVYIYYYNEKNLTCELDYRIFFQLVLTHLVSFFDSIN